MHFLNIVHSVRKSNSLRALFAHNIIVPRSMEKLRIFLDTRIERKLDSFDMNLSDYFVVSFVSKSSGVFSRMIMWMPDVGADFPQSNPKSQSAGL